MEGLEYVKHRQLGLGLRGMDINDVEYLSTNPLMDSNLNRNRAMNLINPPWILVKVVNVPIEINESH